MLRLVCIDEETIYQNFKELLEDEAAYQKMAHACNPNGDGNACKRIADILEFGEYELVGGGVIVYNNLSHLELT